MASPVLLSSSSIISTSQPGIKRDAAKQQSGMFQMSSQLLTYDIYQIEDRRDKVNTVIISNTKDQLFSFFSCVIGYGT